MSLNFSLPFRVSVLFLVSMLSVSCTEPEKPEIRAVARWNAMIQGDWEKAYSYESPAYRAANTMFQLRDSFGHSVKWESIELVDSEQVNDKVVKVRLYLNSTYEGLDFPSQFTERWLLKENQWWHVKK